MLGFNLVSVLALVMMGSSAYCADGKAYKFKIQDGVITPTSIQVEKGQVIELAVTNLTKEGQEYEIPQLDREVSILPTKTETFSIGPLAPGVYLFQGDKAKGGKIIVK